jgi:hypothetical protein
VCCVAATQRLHLGIAAYRQCTHAHEADRDVADDSRLQEQLVDDEAAGLADLTVAAQQVPEIEEAVYGKFCSPAADDGQVQEVAANMHRHAANSHSSPHHPHGQQQQQLRNEGVWHGCPDMTLKDVCQQPSVPFALKAINSQVSPVGEGLVEE